MSLLQIDGYTLISQGKICSGHAGLAIYLSNIYNYKSLDICKKSNMWEGQFIEVTANTVNKKTFLETYTNLLEISLRITKPS